MMTLTFNSVRLEIAAAAFHAVNRAASAFHRPSRLLLLFEKMSPKLPLSSPVAVPTDFEELFFRDRSRDVSRRQRQDLLLDVWSEAKK
jgi:hypothetical protein